MTRTMKTDAMLDVFYVRCMTGAFPLDVVLRVAGIRSTVPSAMGGSWAGIEVGNDGRTAIQHRPPVEGQVPHRHR